MAGSRTYLDLLRALNEALVRRLGVGVEGVPLGVFPLFVRSVGVLGVLLTGLGLGPASESPTAAKRDRFGEGGGRLHAATDQYSGGLARARGRLDIQNVNPLRPGLRSLL
jgi:hypothetical protein